MKRYWSKTRLEIKGTGLGGEDLSENKQLLEDVTERFEESSKNLDPKQILKKDSVYRQRKKRKLKK